VIVSHLAAPELVTRENHRGAVRHEQRRQEIALLLIANGVDGLVISRALGTVIGAAIVANGRPCCPRHCLRCASRWPFVRAPRRSPASPSESPDAGWQSL